MSTGDSSHPSHSDSPPPAGATYGLGLTPKLPSPFYPASLCPPRDGTLQAKSVLPPSLTMTPLHQAPQAVDERDVGTPDAWIPRDESLVRLTGKHPFNAESRLSNLMEHGFLTPTGLFFVRNHGAVPRVDEEMAREWRVEIHGICEKPLSLTVADLSERFEVISLPVTLVCAGNRRKEQNIVRKSLGFSWGAGGVSTALFTGVRLADVIEAARPLKGAKHVIFEGADDRLPNGPYGTSQLLSWARDARRGMMLVWAMNGLPLEPDHGFPLRLVVPGQIGGRSVKWLKRIEFSENESQHHLHFHDNKVLPTTVGPEQARNEAKWWYDSRYMIRELNVNSVIASPDHGEVLFPPISGDVAYNVKGYAYSGGGRRITRVEITLDDGASWTLANIEYPEDTFRTHLSTSTTGDPEYGFLGDGDVEQSFCWCFWNLDVSVEALHRASGISVRAMDESLALQPRDMYWNATGMMNNWWFRVAILHQSDGSARFEHPTMAGPQVGGWMQRLKDEGRDPARPIFSVLGVRPTGQADTIAQKTEVVMIRPDISREINMVELREHGSASERPWFVVNGQVYDPTPYLAEHPGGAQSITIVAGEDATDDFMAIHSADARRKLAEWHIGTLVPSVGGRESDNPKSVTEISPSQDNLESSKEVFLHPKRWKSVTLLRVTPVSSDAKVFRFSLDAPSRSLGLPTGQHVYVRLRRKGRGNGGPEVVQRAYTPLSHESDTGLIDILVKIYYPTAKFPFGGRMSLGFTELKVGDSVDIKGPIGHFSWLGSSGGELGNVSIHGRMRRVARVGMVCAGSGVTPILQVLRGIFDDAVDATTEVGLLDINRTLSDILCKTELDALGITHVTRLRIAYSLTGNFSGEWRGLRGRVTKEMLAQSLPPPGEDAMVCICGPSAMEQTVQGMLVDLGWALNSQIVVF